MTVTKLDLKITADAKAAQRGLQGLSTSLEGVTKDAQKTESALNDLDKPIKVNLNDEAIENANNEIARLRAQIRRDLRLDVNANTKVAEKRIRELQRTVRVLDSKDARIDVKVDVDKAGLGRLKSLKGVGQELATDLTSATGALGGVAAAAGPVGVAIAAVAGSAFIAVKGISALAQQASGLDQAIGGSDAVFKDVSQAMQDFAEDADQSAGLSQRSYLEMATVIGAQLKNLGFTLAESAVLTSELTQRGADLAATFGGSTAQAVEAITSALRGEMDPIERYGISAGEAAIKTKAMELGFWSGVGAIDAHSKAMTVNALIMEQSADAAGQFARESDSLAGKQAKLTAEWENMTTALGEGVLPLVTDFLTVGNQLTQTMSELTTEGGRLSDVWGEIPGPLKTYLKLGAAALNLPAGIAVGVHEWATEIEKMPPTLEPVTAAQQALTKETNDWSYAMGVSGKAVDDVTASVKEQAAALEGLKSAVGGAAGAFAKIGGDQRTELRFEIDQDNLREEIAKAFKGKGAVKLPKNGLDMSDVEFLPDNAQAQLLRLSEFVQEGLERGAQLAEIDPDFDPAKFESKLRGETVKLLVDAGMKPGAAKKLVDDLLLGTKDAKVEILADLTTAIQNLNEFLNKPSEKTVTVGANTQPAILTMSQIPVPSINLPVHANTQPAIRDMSNIPVPTIYIPVRFNYVENTPGEHSGGRVPTLGSIVPQGLGDAATVAGLRGTSTQAVAMGPGVVTQRPTQTQQATVTQLAPKQVPVKIYLDGAEIADHLQLKTSRLATTSSVRRRA